MVFPVYKFTVVLDGRTSDPILAVPWYKRALLFEGGPGEDRACCR